MKRSEKYAFHDGSLDETSTSKLIQPLPLKRKQRKRGPRKNTTDTDEFEQTVILTPKSAVIKLCKLEPIDVPLPSDESLDRDQYNMLELEDDDVISYGNHSFLSGMIKAYEMHKSITLSPDIIWLLIVQGFSYHVAKNVEKLRSLLVTFNGKEQLTVEREELTPATATKDDWIGIVKEFIEQIDKKTKDHIAPVLEPKFSTTTPCSHTAGMISIMSAMKHYFDYKVAMMGCGYPSITIEGTAEDWELVKEKTLSLSTYDLEWWTSELIPVIDEFINARKGSPDYSFWLKMIRQVKGKGMYDPSYIDGWICTFFPYDRFGRRMSLTKIYETTDLASEILDTPFILKLLGNPKLGIPDVEINSQFDTGFFGVKETKEGPGVYNVKPIIGWGFKIGVPPDDSDD